jgi:hypothetical protein
LAVKLKTHHRSFDLAVSSAKSLAASLLYQVHPWMVTGGRHRFETKDLGESNTLWVQAFFTILLNTHPDAAARKQPICYSASLSIGIHHMHILYA